MCCVSWSPLEALKIGESLKLPGIARHFLYLHLNSMAGALLFDNKSACSPKQYGNLPRAVPAYQFMRGERYNGHPSSHWQFVYGNHCAHG